MRVIEPVFPCYVFVRCNLEEGAEAIRHTYGISSLVHFGYKIPPVPDQIIEDLQQCFESEEPLTAEECLTAGTEVTVADGAFMGSHGVVVRVLPAKRRVQILLDFLGRTTLTEVDRNVLMVEDGCLADLMPSLAILTSARAARPAMAA